MKSQLQNYLKTNIIEDDSGNYVIGVESPKDWMEGWLLKMTIKERQVLLGKLKVLTSSNFISLEYAPLANLCIDYRKIVILDESGLKEFFKEVEKVAGGMYKKQKPWAELVNDNAKKQDGYNR